MSGKSKIKIKEWQSGLAYTALFAGISYVTHQPIYAAAGPVVGTAYSLGVGLVAVSSGKIIGCLLGITPALLAAAARSRFDEKYNPSDEAKEWHESQEPLQMLDKLPFLYYKAGFCIGVFTGYTGASERGAAIINDKFDIKTEKTSEIFSNTSRCLTDAAAPLPPRTAFYFGFSPKAML